jgi:hypothetical protein
MTIENMIDEARSLRDANAGRLEENARAFLRDKHEILFALIDAAPSPLAEPEVDGCCSPRRCSRWFDSSAGSHALGRKGGT